MKGKIFLVDTFTSQAFKGNPTAVCITDTKLPDAKMLLLAAELNLPVTVFVNVKDVQDDSYSIRYFTTITEIPACGHATLAAANIVFELTKTNNVRFKTISNVTIDANEKNDIVWLSYPVYEMKDYKPSSLLLKSVALGSYKSIGICDELETVFIELDDPALLRSVSPDFGLMLKGDAAIKEVVLTSISDDSNFDFLLRSFCPWIGIDEDPVTGSVHSVLAGFWNQRLKKSALRAYQASARGGEVWVNANEGNVEIGGKSVLIFTGELV